MVLSVVSVYFYKNVYLPRNFIKTYVDNRYNMSFANIDEHEKIKNEMLDEALTDFYHHNGSNKVVRDYYIYNKIISRLDSFDIYEQYQYKDKCYISINMTIWTSNNEEINFKSKINTQFILDKVSLFHYKINYIKVKSIEDDLSDNEIIHGNEDKIDYDNNINRNEFIQYDVTDSGGL